MEHWKSPELWLLYGYGNVNPQTNGLVRLLARIRMFVPGASVLSKSKSAVGGKPDFGLTSSKFVY